MGEIMPWLALPVPPGHRVTQYFGDRPEYYRRFGLPGHEGIDWSITDEPVLSCANGVVSEVGWRYKGHAYGYAVRVVSEHLGEVYEIVYAHLREGSALVERNERVVVGQPLGIADGTGNVQGNHLHLTLKKLGATKSGETPYPYDVIDPYPHLIWDVAPSVP